MKNPLRKLVRRVGKEDPLLLAHHPTCEYYSHHVIELYGQKLCMGCFIVYPVGGISLLVLVLSRLTIFSGQIAGVATYYLYIAGFVLISPKVLSKIIPGRRTRRQRILTKAILAVGLAFVAFPFIFRPSERIQTLCLFFGFLIPYVGHKAWTATDDCEGCPEADDFPNCSGMSFDDTYTYSTDDQDG
jgi:hypothetical protein